MKTKTVTKPAKKAVTKTKAKPLFYASLLAEALAGKFGETLKDYYAGAKVYHDRKKTVFPRPRNEKVALLTQDEAVKFLEAHKVSSIPSKNPVGQRLYDEMRVQAG